MEEKREPNISYIWPKYYGSSEIIFGATASIDIWSVSCALSVLLEQVVLSFLCSLWLHCFEDINANDASFIFQLLFPGESRVDQLV